MFDLNFKLFTPMANYRLPCSGKVIVLQQGNNPSTDYYIRSRLLGRAESDVLYIDINSHPDKVFLQPGALVIIVRYIELPWLKWLQKNRDQLSGVVYFMDDDLPAAMWSFDLPLRYRYKIFSKFIVYRQYLARVCSDIWLSTDVLVQRYAASHVSCMTPLPVPAIAANDSMVSLFYHGSGSHLPEYRWLKNVVMASLENNADLSFIAIGDESVKRLFRGLSRVIVINQMDWLTYSSSLHLLRHDIGLAPLLATRFNSARSYVKYFDITRFGAAGIYSRSAPFIDFVSDGYDGLLCENRPELWVDAISCLARSPLQRRTLLENARIKQNGLIAQMDGLGL